MRLIGISLSVDLQFLTDCIGNNKSSTSREQRRIKKLCLEGQDVLRTQNAVNVWEKDTSRHPSPPWKFIMPPLPYKSCAKIDEGQNFVYFKVKCSKTIVLTVPTQELQFPQNHLRICILRWLEFRKGYCPVCPLLNCLPSQQTYRTHYFDSCEEIKF